MDGRCPGDGAAGDLRGGGAVTSPLLNTCQVCGAEESLDAMLARMIDDGEVRRLIADVVTRSLALGGHVVRYLRLHKPPKHRLSTAKMRVVLAELVPAVVQGGFTRKGRDWAMGRDGWDAAFAAVFRAADEGKLDLPLTGNAYLFEVAMRLADKAEAQQERGQEQALRSRAHTSSVPTDIAGLATAALAQKDPALAKLDADRAKAAPMPAELREKINKLKKGA